MSPAASNGATPQQKRERADAGAAVAIHRPERLAPLTVDAVQPYLPAIGDAIVPLGLAPDGKQLRGAYCVSAADARAAADQIAGDSTVAGWSGVAARGEPPITGVSADRDGLHFSVVIRGGDAVACAQAQHRYAANATIFRLTTAQP